MEIRSGRFKKSGLNVDPLIIVISKKGEAIYRVFNSGESDFRIKTETYDDILKPTHSVDIADGGAWKIYTLNSTDVAEGIYDLLTVGIQTRSGRFKIAGAATPQSHKVIYLKTASQAYYRFFNSGDRSDDAAKNPTFQIEGFKVNGTMTKYTLEPGMTVDIEVEKNREITVKSDKANVAIEGIYEFLGN